MIILFKKSASFDEDPINKVVLRKLLVFKIKAFLRSPEGTDEISSTTMEVFSPSGQVMGLLKFLNPAEEAENEDLFTEYLEEPVTSTD